MRVLVAGATGHLGRPLVRRLVDARHQVAGTTRTPGKRGLLEELGVHPILMDALEPEQVQAALGDWRPEAVVHTLTALPPTGPLRHRDMAATDRLRRSGTRNLLHACRQVGVQRVVAESMVFAYGYGDHGPQALTEDATLGQGGRDPATREHVEAVRDLERQVLHATARGELEGIALRYGLFYGPGGWWDRAADLLRLRLFPLPGGGGGLLPWVHVEDAADATVAALERGHPGDVYNVVDDEPARFRDLVNAFADALDLPRPWSLPVRLSRRLAPLATQSLADTRLVVSNRKAKDAIDWTPRHPTYRDGVQNLTGTVADGRT